MAGVSTRLFDAGEFIESGRLRLGALDGASVEAMRPWLEAAVAPEWSWDDLEAARAASEAVLITDGLENPIGCALLGLDSPRPDHAIIRFLAVEPSRRYRGLGGEAGLAVERHARQRAGQKTFYAGVPEDRGLGVYFWLRLGYHPLPAARAPAVPLGLTAESKRGIWMLRESA